MSSAYCESLTSSCSSIVIPFISFQRLILCASNSIQMTNSEPESAWATLTHSASQMKVFRGVSVIQNTTRDIFIEYFYPLTKVKTKIKRFEAFMIKTPLNRVKSFFEIQKRSYSWDILLFNEMHSVCYKPNAFPNEPPINIPRLAGMN